MNHENVNSFPNNVNVCFFFVPRMMIQFRKNGIMGVFKCYFSIPRNFIYAGILYHLKYYQKSNDECDNKKMFTKNVAGVCSFLSAILMHS